MKTVKISIVCTLSPEPVDGLVGHSFLQKRIFHLNIIRDMSLSHSGHPTPGSRANVMFCWTTYFRLRI